MFNLYNDIEINGKRSTLFLKKLDYSIKSKERRLQIVKEILEDKYWIDYYDKYLNVNLISSSGLSTENPICKTLEKISNYLMYLPDSEKINKKTQNNIYKTEEDLSKSANRELKIENLNSNSEIAINNILNNNLIYRKNCEQQILKEDMNKTFIKDYSKANNELNNIIEYGYKYKTRIKRVLENDKLSKEEKVKEINRIKKMHNKYKIKIHNMNDRIEKRIEYLNKQPKTKENIQNINILYYIKKYYIIILNKYRKENKGDMILIKNAFDKITDFLYVNNMYLREKQINLLDEFDFSNKNHVKMLLYVIPDNSSSEDMRILYNILNKYISKCDFDNRKKLIINYLRKDETLLFIANKLNTTYQNIQAQINIIINRIINENKKEYDIWYYLNKENCKYKLCTKCNQKKLINEFRIRETGSYRNECIECEKKYKRNKK